MKYLFTLFTALVLFVAFGSANAQDSLQVKSQYKNQVKTKSMNQVKTNASFRFVDENGDGYNDNAPDQDGDGIPNGQDEDYTGSKMRNGNSSKGFVDEDGDGINDNALDSDGDGIPNGQDEDFVRPQDGTGSKFQNGRGQGSKGAGVGTGTGECDGTGPKGYKGSRK